MTHHHPNAGQIVADFADWATAADESRPLSDTERQRLRLAVQAPLQSKGRPVEDAAHLPLFVATNEPGLPL